jgi:hypothetical protein
MARCRCNSLLDSLPTLASAGEFTKLIANSRNRHTFGGATYTTLVNVFVLITSGDLAVLDSSLPDRSFAMGIRWEGALDWS